MDYLPHIDRPNFDPEATEHLLLQMGYALAMVQELEFTLATYISIVVDIEPGDAVDIAARIFEKNERKTIGSLLSGLRESERLREDLVSRIEALRPERNWLAHRSNRSGREVLNKPERLAVLLLRLTSLADEALELSKAISTELDGYNVAHGVAQEDLDRWTREIAREWEGT